MKKANVSKLEQMAAGFLQYRWGIHLMTKRAEENGELNRPKGWQSPDFVYYQGACAMVESFGGEWRRFYKGDDTKEALNNIDNYSHTVWFPDDEKCSRLNEQAWD